MGSEHEKYGFAIKSGVRVSTNKLWLVFEYGSRRRKDDPGGGCSTVDSD